MKNRMSVDTDSTAESPNHPVEGKTPCTKKVIHLYEIQEEVKLIHQKSV